MGGLLVASNQLNRVPSTETKQIKATSIKKIKNESRLFLDIFVQKRNPDCFYVVKMEKNIQKKYPEKNIQKNLDFFRWT